MNVENRLCGWYPHVLRRAPTLGNGRAWSPRCPKAQTFGRHPIPVRNPWLLLRSRIRVELNCPNCRTLGVTQPTERAYFRITAFRAPPPARFVRVADCADVFETWRARLPAGWCPFGNHEPTPFTLKWRHFEPPSILCAVGWALVFAIYSLSYRDIEEHLTEPSPGVDDTTI